MTEIEKEEPPISEYTDKYRWKDIPVFVLSSHSPAPVKEVDPYEQLVELKIKGNSPKKDKPAPKIEKELDEYELLVQKKINEPANKEEKPKEQNKQEEKPKDQNDQAPSLPKQEISDIKNEKSIKPQNTQEKPKAKDVKPNETPRVNEDQNAETHSIKDKSAKHPRKTFNAPIKSSLEAPEKIQPPEQKNNTINNPKPKKQKTSRFLSSSTNNIHPKVTVYRPNFYADPNDAPEEERPNLHGPFWVYWPKGTVIPEKYSGLRKVLKRK